MKKVSLFVPAAVVAVIFGAWSCGKSVSEKAVEKATEKAIEKSTNGAADVDLDSGSLKVNVNGASWQAGSNVQMPSGFPSDVFVIDGTLTSAITTVENQAYTLTITSSASVADAKSQYQNKLTDEGWTSTASASFGETETIIAEKNNRTVTVSIAQDTSESGKTSVVLTTSTKSTATNTEE